MVENEIISGNTTPELSYPISRAYQPTGILLSQNTPCRIENTGIWNWMCFFTFNCISLKTLCPKLLIIGQYQDQIYFILPVLQTVTCFLYQIIIHSSLICFLFLSSLQKCCRNSSVWSKKQHHLSRMHTQISSGFY